LNKIGEKIFNLQRAVLLREGWGGRGGDRLLDYFFREPLKEGEVYFDYDCLVLGKDDEVISKKGHVLDGEEFETMKSEYYGLRGWDVESGLPTRRGLKALGLDDVADGLAEQGLVK
jgi:aldehyde:ferredoxin oxidoreductase